MDPSEAEAAVITSIAAGADWAGLLGEAADVDSSRGSLFGLLGVSGDEHPRITAQMGGSALEQSIYGWKIAPDGTSPTPAQWSQAGLMGRACRAVCGLGQNDLRSELAALRDQVASLQSAPSAPQPEPSAEPTHVKLSTVVDQSLDFEVPLLGNASVQAFYAAYKRAAGGLPSAEDDLTVEQVSGLAAKAARGKPHVDFSIFGPHGYRILKKVSLVGFVICASTGDLRKTETRGPPTFALWERCWRVFRAGYIGLELLKTQLLDAYHLIYQVDVRARFEQWERIRRRGELDRADASQAGNEHPFDLAKPAFWVMEQLLKDSEFWHKELEKKAGLIVARCRGLASMLGGDAPVAPVSQPLLASSKRVMNSSTPVAARGSQWEQQRLSKLPRTEQGHYTNEEGTLYTHNRCHFPLCAAWQLGQCQKGSQGVCPLDPSARHQCAKCLGESHGANECNQTPRQRDASNSAKGGGRGKSKGKG
jgi:hypothetical protein